MVRIGFCIALLFAACAAVEVAQALPGTTGAGEPLPPPVAPEPGANARPSVAPVPIAAVDPGAEADFRDAKARFDAGDQGAARAALEAFVARHPQDGERPAAELLLARLALLRNEPAVAQQILDPIAATPPDPGTGSSARYYLGLAETRLGHAVRARELLLPFLPPPGAAGPGDDALVELRGALAEATEGAGELPAALELWDAYARGGREPEKAYARERASDIVAKLSPDVAAETFRASAEKGLARALLGPPAAAYLRAHGDPSGAGEVEKETAAARRAVGLEPASVGSGGGDSGRLGLAVALSGKYQPVGEAALRAAFVATGAPAATAGQGMEIYLRDTGAGADRPARAVTELARDESVIGVVSAVNAGDSAAVGAASAAAADSGVALLDLDDAGGGPAAPSFALLHSGAARAGALAHAAIALGARDFAVVGPDSAAGERLRRAFVTELGAAGGRVSADVSYPAGSTSFTGAVAAIKRARPQAIFVADDADRLELIAPALAAADLWSAAWGSKRAAPAPGQSRVRNVLLLSTANGLSPRLVQNAGRYVQGALLAPGFCASAADPRARAFVDAYRAAYGQDPHATEAYAYDGVNAFRSAIANGARTRADVVAAFAGGGSFEGLTGAMRFGPDHARVDEPRLYVVDGADINVWTSR